jgi:flagellar M-ring protein FliF
MNTAVAEIDLPPPRPQNALADGFARLDSGKKFTLGVGLLAVLVVLLAIFFMGRQAEWRVLYANLSDKDGGAVLAQLSTLNIPYKHAEGGSAILVPADKVHDTRLRLASQGLPRGSTVGFELMDTSRLGMTQFQERLTFQRGLEGELTRSITALASVADARIHLALPNQNGFFREQQKPSASVLLTLHAGRTLDRAQVAGIVHLVASSVPELNPQAVSVVDQNGNLLAPMNEDANSIGADSRQLQYVRTLEQQYVQRILDLLEPLVGRENVRAQVTADVDFSLTEQTSEEHRPNQNGAPSTVRSQQIVEAGEGAGALNVPGAPGAVANQPPGPNAAPINGEAQAVGVNGAAGAGALGANGRREQVINYEVDRTVRVTRNSTGNVRRLNAAVVVNHRTGTDPRGNVTTTALPPEQIEQMTALVREAIGFSPDRGDSVNLMNAPFTRLPEAEVVEVAWWKQPDTIDLARSMAWPAGMLLLGLIVFLGMVRPALKMMQQPALEVTPAAPGGQLNAVIDDDTERPALPVPAQNINTPEMLRLEDAKRLARENPVAVANIVSGWVSGESSATA